MDVGMACQNVCKQGMDDAWKQRWKYRSLKKKGPVSNIRPPPIIASISCKGLKFTPKSAHPIDRVRKVFEQHDARLVYSYTEYNI